jgi:hypothetical protein
MRQRDFSAKSGVNLSYEEAWLIRRRRRDAGGRVKAVLCADPCSWLCFFIEAAAPRVASGLDGVSSRLGAIGDMRTNAQPASRNERITWITSPSCRTAIGRPQRRKTFSMGRLRESTSASSQSRPFTRAMAMI